MRFVIAIGPQWVLAGKHVAQPTHGKLYLPASMQPPFRKETER